jgi:hypothetical protein
MAGRPTEALGPVSKNGRDYLVVREDQKPSIGYAGAIGGPKLSRPALELLMQTILV